MPKVTFLTSQHIAVEKGREIDQESSSKNGGPVTVEAWTIVLTDRTYGDQIRLTIRKDARDDLVKMLTGGIILAGGDLPSV